MNEFLYFSLFFFFFFLFVFSFSCYLSGVNTKFIIRRQVSIGVGIVDIGVTLRLLVNKSKRCHIFNILIGDFGLSSRNWHLWKEGLVWWIKVQHLWGYFNTSFSIIQRPSFLVYVKIFPRIRLRLKVRARILNSTPFLVRILQNCDVLLLSSRYISLWFIVSLRVETLYFNTSEFV